MKLKIIIIEKVVNYVNANVFINKSFNHVAIFNKNDIGQ